MQSTINAGISGKASAMWGVSQPSSIINNTKFAAALRNANSYHLYVRSRVVRRDAVNVTSKA